MVQWGPQKHDVAPVNCSFCWHIYDDYDVMDDDVLGDDDDELKPSRQQEGAKVP